MTVVESRRSLPRLELGSTLSGQSRSDLLEHVAMLALLAIWAVPFTRATGGRGVHNELIFAVALLLLLPAMKAWRAPTRSIALAALTAAAAELVCALAPSSWYGSDVAAGYAIAAGCFVAGRRYVRDSDRRLLVAVGICLAGIYQFEQAFIPWHGGGSAEVEMSGTFYWHNPYAAFLVPGAVIGLGLIATRRSPWNIVGWVSMPLCTAGIVFSSSRATMAVLLVAWLLVVAFGLRGRAVLLRAAGALGLTAAVVFALPGPPFFPHYTAPWTATATRGATQSLGRNGGFRTEFWREAIQVALHHPLVGSGFHVLASASAFYTPSNWARSPLAHDGYLQALSDGGLLLGVPFLLGAVIVLFWALRPLWATLRRAERDPQDIVQLSIAVALLGLFAHSAVDFDWSHPSILVETALMACCVAPIARSSARRLRLVGFGALATLAAVLVVSIPELHQWQIDQPNVRNSTDTLLADASGTFGDYRPAQALLDAYANGQRVLTQLQAQQALALTKREAGVDLHLAMLRDAVGAQSGLVPDAVAAARHELTLVDGSTTPYVPDLALVYIDAGNNAAAGQLLATDIGAQAARGVAQPDLEGELVMWAQRLGRGSAYACQQRAVRSLIPSAELDSLPKPTAACPAGDQGHA